MGIELLIVDPQNDFITGTLAVQGAKEKMLKLSDYIKDFKDEYDYVFVTLDTHPIEHCSFKENGGMWPSHCVFLTNGWHMPEYLSDAFDGYESLFVYNKTSIGYIFLSLSIFNLSSISLFVVCSNANTDQPSFFSCLTTSIVDSAYSQSTLSVAPKAVF